VTDAVADPACRRGLLADLHDLEASTDPDFIAKMHRVLDPYDHSPADGRVICVDGFGPLNPQPRKGKAWRLAGSPRRLGRPTIAMTM
jgi:hypothetical protein